MGHLQFSCSNCGEAITVSAEQAGFVTYCPNCQAELIVPEIVPPPPPPPAQTYQSSPAESIRLNIPDPGLHESPSQILERRIVRTGERATPVTPPPEPVPPALPDPVPPIPEPRSLLQPPTPNIILPGQELQTSIIRPEDAEFNDIAETEIYDPQALSGSARLDEGYMQAHAGEVHIGSDVHAYVHDNNIPHTHAIPYYNGVFQPFGETEVAAALTAEDPMVAARAASVSPTPTAWPCSVFGVVIEARIDAYLPESLPDVNYPSVMFGSAEKYLPLIRELEPRFLSIMEPLTYLFGAEFQYALGHYDLYRMVGLARQLDEPLAALYSFMSEVQQLALPKKDPLPQLRELVLSWYPQVRLRLLDIVDRLYYRSQLTPEQAELSSINVALVPAGLYRFNLSLRLIPPA